LTVSLPRTIADTVALVRGHDNQIAVFRHRGIDGRLVGMLMLDLDRLACDACCCLRCCGRAAESFLGVLRALY
jgi:hypothetical protein